MSLTHNTFRLILLIILPLISCTGLLFAQEASAPLQQTASNYKISPKDLVDFRVFQEPELDSVIRVSGDGTAIFPLIDSVKLSGLTVAEATQLLNSRLRDGFLINPQVNITVREYAKKYFTMLGEIAKPGSYDMVGEDEIPLLQAIGMGGGYSKIANPSHITVKRLVEGKEKILKLNAKKMASGTDSSAFMVRPGDIITVGEAIF
jgi:polysaccharide export outer membrane protein